MKHAQLFVDEAELEVESGSGGDGKVAFRREKFVSNGGPNGGDGGRGGDVVLVADTNIATLLDLKSAKRIRADHGAGGGTNDKKGASGGDVEIRVPIGTLVFDLDELDERSATQDISNESDESQAIIDLTEAGQRVVIARGGMGGLGNARFKTSTRQAPDFATPGKPGQARRIRLSLKLLADVGLVGFPNAGKSTLLSRISAARPRVANYPFTTLVPALGVVDRNDRRCVVADIPGLIEGASEGAGLGHQFLRHVERTRVLIHLLDLEAMLVEGRDLLSDYDAIRLELERYQPDLLDRHEIVVLSKIDVVHDEALLEDLMRRLAERGLEVMRISAAGSRGIDELLHVMFDAVDEAKRVEQTNEERA
jgi:GTP-binding protein